MATVKYDLSGVEDLPDTPHAPVGTYVGEIEAVDSRDSSKGNPMLEVRWKLIRNADGSRLKEEFQPIWDYPLLQHDSKFVMARTKAFFEGIGLKLKGSLNTDKMVGLKAQLKLKSDTDQDGDYRPRIGKIMPVGAGTSEPEAEEPEAEEPEAEEPEDDGAVDLDALDRDGLKALIKEEKLGTLKDLGITKATSDDEIREIIANAMGGEEEAEPEPEEEPEEEPEAEPEAEEDDGGEAEEDGYDAMSIKDLAAEVKERDLDIEPLKGLKGAKLKTQMVEALRADDAESPF